MVRNNTRRGKTGALGGGNGADGMANGAPLVGAHRAFPLAHFAPEHRLPPRKMARGRLWFPRFGSRIDSFLALAHPLVAPNFGCYHRCVEHPAHACRGLYCGQLAALSLAGRKALGRPIRSAFHPRQPPHPHNPVQRLPDPRTSAPVALPARLSGRRHYGQQHRARG